MQASIPERATEAAKSHAYGCPLCNCGADSEDDIYWFHTGRAQLLARCSKEWATSRPVFNPGNGDGVAE
jgi:hypothetical protein